MQLAGAKVYVHGRLRGMTQRRVARLVADAGGAITRRGAIADIVVVGHASAAASLAEGGDLDLRFDPSADASLVSEATFKRAVGRLPAHVAEPGSYSGAQLAQLSGLTLRHVRSLALYDILAEASEPFGYGDLVAARSVKSLLAAGTPFGKVVAAAIALKHRGGSLPGARLAQTPWGEIVQDVAGRLARLDGQFLLPLTGGDIDADAAFARGETAEEDGDLAQAARWYELAARLDRTDPVIAFNLGNVLDEQGRPGEAEIAYRLALARDPRLPDAWFNLGVLQERTGRAAQALASYRQALLLDPDYPDVLHNAATLLMADGAFEAAAAMWERLASTAMGEAAKQAKRCAHLCRLEIMQRTAP